MQAHLVDRAIVAAETAAFFFELEEGPLQFTPGQTCDFTIPEPLYRDDKGTTRTFSIASVPGDSRLMIATRLRASAFKRSLMDAPLGTPIDIDGPYGSFTLHQNARKPAVFLAGGIGITPFRSIIGDATARHLSHAIQLLYSNRNAAATTFLSDLERWARANANFRFVATVTDPDADEAWRYDTGLIDRAFLQRTVQVDGNTVFYVAGPDSFVKAMQGTLPDIGADPDNVRAEEFAGY